MASFEYDIPRVTDAELFKFFQKSAIIIGATAFSIQEMGRPSAFQFSLEKPDSDAINAFLKSKLYTIDNASVGVPYYSVSVRRNLNAGANFAFDRLSVTSDIKPSHDGSPTLPPNADQIHDVNLLINDTFLARAEQSSGLFHNSKTFTLLMQSHQTMMEQLQRTITNVGEQAASVRLKLEEEFSTKKLELETELAAHRTELEGRIQDERSKLNERQTELDEFKKNLDDRSNTFARRDLHKSLKARIADRAKKFEITPETKGSRQPIHFAVMGGLVLLGFLIYYYSIPVAAAIGTTSIWAIVAVSVKPALLTITLLGLLTWYLRWMNRWFERHADAEFSLKQFELDIDRASWVVETALEWKQSQDTPIPDQLLENISRNLFSKSDKDENADMHPADFLASAILGRASGLNLKLPGAEISYTGKDIKKLQNET